METTELAVQEKIVAPEQIAGKSFSLVPQSLAEAMELAKIIADSDLAPKDFKGKPGNTLIAVQMGTEIGISPMQAIQNIAVINGKPGVYGDMGKALLLSKGCRIEERDVKQVRELGEAWCKITRPDGSQPTIRTYSIEDAETAGLWGKQGPWTTNTWRQMAWRAFWFAARDGAADYLHGLAGIEEVRDYIDIPSDAKPPIAEPQRASAKAAQDKAAEDFGPLPPDEPAPQVMTKPIAPKEWKAMPSKVDGGTCSTCKRKMDKGTPIYFDPTGRVAHHVEHFA